MLLAPPGRSATIDWNLGAAGDFNTATNWLPEQVPAMGDDAVNDSAFTITDSGSNTVKSFSTLGNLDLSGSAFEVLNGLTLQSAATTISATSGARLEFDGTQSLTGPGIVTFDSNGNNAISIEGTSTLTVGSGVMIEGETATIGYQYILAGDNALVNDGTIGSTVSGGTFTIGQNQGDPLTVTNGGTFQATNGGHTNFANTVNIGGTGNMTATGTGSVIQFSGTIGLTGTTTADISGGAAFNNTSTLNTTGLTLNLTGALNNNGAVLTSTDGLTVNGGTITDNSGGEIEFLNTQTLGGNTTITFDSNGNNRLTVEGTSTLTIGANILIDGETANIGYEVVTPGSNNIINNGTIGSTVSGGTFTFYDEDGTLSLTNSGTIQALNGGKDVFEGTTNIGGTGNMTATGTGSVIQFSGTIGLTGTTTADISGGAAFNNTSTLNTTGLTLNLTGALNNNGAVLTSTDGLTVNGGTITNNSGGEIEFLNTQTLGGNTTITFDSNGNNRLTVEGTSTLTIGANILIDGETADIGYEVVTAGSNNIINNGTIGSTVSGGTFTFYDEDGTLSLTNSGTIQATNGGVDSFQGTLALNGTGNLTASGASTIRFDGTVSATGTTTATIPSSAAFNIVGGTTLTADNWKLNLTGALNNNGGTLIGIDNLTVNGGTIFNNSGGYIEFEQNPMTLANPSLNGPVTITFDSNGNNRLNVEGTATLTVASNVLIDGTTALIGYQNVTAGDNGIINNGTIGSTVAGGTFTIEPNGGQTLTVTNNGTIQALNGGTDNFAGTVDLSGGMLTATGSGSRIQFTGITSWSGSAAADITGGAALNNTDTLNIDGLTLTLTGALNNNGATINLNGDLTVNGGTVTNNSGGIINVLNTLTFGGATTLTFDTNGNNALYIEGTSVLTVGPNVVINGATTSIGYQHLTAGSNGLTNEGTIGSTVSGGTFTIEPYSGQTLTLINSGTILASGGGLTHITVPAADITQAGTVWAESGSTVTFDTGYTQTGGATIADGTLNATGGSGIVLSAGTLSGKGIVNGAVTNNGGTVVPGDKTGATFGTLTVNGAFTQGSGGTYLEQIGGTTSGSQYTTLALNSTMALDGPLDIQLLGGFVPAHDATFDIITGYTSRTGTFAGLVDVGGQQNWEINYLDGSKIVQLVATPAPDSLAVLGLGLSGLGGMLKLRRARRR
jgi:hypothetical protein